MPFIDTFEEIGMVRGYAKGIERSSPSDSRMPPTSLCPIFGRSETTRSWKIFSLPPPLFPARTNCEGCRPTARTRDGGRGAGGAIAAASSRWTTDLRYRQAGQFQHQAVILLAVRARLSSQASTKSASCCPGGS